MSLMLHKTKNTIFNFCSDKIADISKFELVNTDKSGKINARIVKDDRKCVKFAFASAYCEEEGVS